MECPDLSSAAADYLFLLNRGYPENPAVRLIGDRYRLSREERIMLFRGLSPTKKAEERRKKLVPEPCSREIHVDGYNVFFTILNYRQGKRVFLSSDGFLRDAGGVHGRISDQTLLREILRGVIFFLRERNVETVRIYLDAPVSRSGEHGALIRQLLPAAGLAGSPVLCDSADYCLKAARPACASTSDSGIIDALGCGIYDLARSFLEIRYDAEFFRFL